MSLPEWSRARYSLRVYTFTSSIQAWWGFSRRGTLEKQIYPIQLQYTQAVLAHEDLGCFLQASCGSFYEGRTGDFTLV
jgi:hypothetical protein